MIFAQYRPGPPLDGYVEHFWFYEGLEIDHDRERVLPDGTFELIFNLRGAPRKLFNRDSTRDHRSYRQAWVSGTQAGYLVIDAVPGSSLMGAHFRPGGAAAVLGLPADAAAGEVLDLDSVWETGVSDLHGRLVEAPTPAAKFQILEELLLARREARLARDAAIAHAVRSLQHEPGMTRIDRVASELGLSHKHFIARFKRQVGLTPKRFCRIARFQRVLTEIAAQRPLDWADLASNCGYYDQSHFINEFRHFSGLNPSEYLVEPGEYRNFVPIRDRSPR